MIEENIARNDMIVRLVTGMVYSYGVVDIYYVYTEVQKLMGMTIDYDEYSKVVRYAAQ